MYILSPHVTHTAATMMLQGVDVQDLSPTFLQRHTPSVGGAYKVTGSAVALGLGALLGLKIFSRL